MRLHKGMTGGLIGLAACAAGAAGCADDHKYGDLKNFVQAHRQDVAAVEYRLEPPDVVEVSSPTAPEVDGEVQQIRSDGKISLRLLGEVKAAGLTPRELAARLEELLSRYYVDPKVNVQVAAYMSKKVYVFGQVHAGGALPFTGRDTVLDVLAETGPTFVAWGAQVKVIRPSAAEDERSEVVVNVDDMMQSGNLRDNFLLKEGDIVYVPPTPLGWLGLRVREVLFPFQPIMQTYDYAVDVKDAPDRWKYGRYGYRYRRKDSGADRRAVAGMLLGR